MNRAEAHVRLTRDPKLAQEWELALLADGLSPRLHRIQDGIVIAVPEEEWERAGASLAAYDRENPAKHDERREPARPATFLTGAVVAAMLLVFFYNTIAWKPNLPWFERGSADAGRILNGELWRTVTALTLHVDLVHVMSNAVGVAIFLGIVSALLGPGIGCALVLLAGAGGNFVNALVQGSPHLSIGASTSVFGAVGILGGLGLARRRRQTTHRRRAWMPIVAALVLLGLLGTEGQRVDIWAHFFGFVAGGFLGVIYDFAAPRRLGHLAQLVSGAAAFAVLIGCWFVAFV